MKLLTFAAACAATFTLTAAPAFANEAIVAKLAQPVPQATKFVAGEAVFDCNGDTCVAASPQSQTFTTATCKAVAAKVGPLTSFAGLKAMDDTRLGACNAVAVARAASGTQMAKH